MDISGHGRDSDPFRSYRDRMEKSNPPPEADKWMMMEAEGFKFALCPPLGNLFLAEGYRKTSAL